MQKKIEIFKISIFLCSLKSSYPIDLKFVLSTIECIYSTMT